MTDPTTWLATAAAVLVPVLLMALSAWRRRDAVHKANAHTLEQVGLALHRYHMELHDLQAAIAGSPRAQAPMDVPPFTPAMMARDDLPVLAPLLPPSSASQPQQVAPEPNAEVDTTLSKPGRFQMSLHVNVEMLPGMDSHMETLARLRREVMQAAGEGVDEEGWLDDKQLWRFLVARKMDVDGARKQAIAALKWRAFRKPHLVRAESDLAMESATGKVCVRGIDRFGRPVLVLDSSKENTTGLDGQMRLLAYQIERAIRLMKAPVDKYVVVIRLGETTMSTLPGPVPTKETLKMLMTVFAERLGHGILYQPPKLFVRVSCSVES